MVETIITPYTPDEIAVIRERAECGQASGPEGTLRLLATLDSAVKQVRVIRDTMHLPAHVHAGLKEATDALNVIQERMLNVGTSDAARRRETKGGGA